MLISCYQVCNQVLPVLLLILRVPSSSATSTGQPVALRTMAFSATTCGASCFLFLTIFAASLNEGLGMPHNDRPRNLCCNPMYRSVERHTAGTDCWLRIQAPRLAEDCPALAAAIALITLLSVPQATAQQPTLQSCVPMESSTES